MLTYADFVELFNSHNREHVYYRNNKPPYSAIIQLSVYEQLSRFRKNPKKSKLTLFRRLALKTGS